MNDEPTMIGPDGYHLNQIVSVDPTAFYGSNLKTLRMNMGSQSQAFAAFVKGYRNGKYTVQNEYGFNFRVYSSEMT